MVLGQLLRIYLPGTQALCPMLQGPALAAITDFAFNLGPDTPEGIHAAATAAGGRLGRRGGRTAQVDARRRPRATGPGAAAGGRGGAGAAAPYKSFARSFNPSMTVSGSIGDCWKPCFG